jgi:hypothetical protein
MITKFKIFESHGNSTADDLIDQLDSSFIEEWYNKHHDIDASEVISMSSQYSIMKFFDEDRYKKDFIRNYYYEFSELSDHDLKEYIENHMDSDKEEKILELYNENNYDEENDIESDIEGVVSFKKTKTGKTTLIVTPTEGKAKKYKIPEDHNIVVEEGEHVIVDELLSTEKDIEYDDDMLNDLDDDQLREVIEDSSEEDDCVSWTIDNWYGSQSGVDIFDEFSGLAIKNGKYGQYKYGSFEELDGSELYKHVKDYIDVEELVDDWKESEDYEYKKETVRDEIYRETELQEKLIEIDPKNALALAELWEDEGDKDNIGDQYDFQKGYIEKYVEDNTDETDDEEYISEIKSDALFYLHEHFGLDSDIREEYRNYLWKVDSDKFNL